MYVVADLDSEEGLAVVQYALTYLVCPTHAHVPQLSLTTTPVDHRRCQLAHILRTQPIYTYRYQDPTRTRYIRIRTLLASDRE